MVRAYITRRDRCKGSHKTSHPSPSCVTVGRLGEAGAVLRELALEKIDATVPKQEATILRERHTSRDDIPELKRSAPAVRDRPLPLAELHPLGSCQRPCPHARPGRTHAGRGLEPGRGMPHLRPLPQYRHQPPGALRCGRDYLSRPVGDTATLEQRVSALETERNVRGATIDWQFTTRQGRTERKKLYPVDRGQLAVVIARSGQLDAVGRWRG